jgi:hypothetical protein
MSRVETAAQGSEVIREMVLFRGHPMVRSLHPTTIEVTTEEDLTENGDCIVGVGASKGCAQLDERIKEGLRRDGSKVKFTIRVGSLSFVVRAEGHHGLELSHRHDIVIRKSMFVSDRTIAVRADAAARDIPREMVELLRSGRTDGRLEVEVGGA